MTYQDDIVALARELKRLKQTSKEIVADTRQVLAVPVSGQPNTVRLTGIAAQDVPLPPQHLELSLPVFGKNGKWDATTRQQYPMNHLGSLQLADRAGIPRKYYESMLHEGMADLTAENVNRWLKHRADRRLFRIADGKVRAVLSDHYRVLDNYDLTLMTMDRAKQHSAVVTDCALTETRMYVKLTVPNYREEVMKGDEVVPGLMVSNSEVGEGALRVEPFLWRLVCKNGLISMSKVYQVHIGGRMEVGENMIYGDDTKQLIDRAFWGRVRDHIDATFNKDIMHQVIAQLRDAASIEIKDPEEAVNVTVKDLGLGEKQEKDLIRYFAKEGDDNLYGLVNGITRLAQDFTDYDQRIDAERYAGKLLEARVPSTKQKAVA